MSESTERSFDDFREAIASLPKSESIGRELLETEPFVLDRSGSLQVVYAPFDYVNEGGRVMLVGVTPGWTQMHGSFVEARAGVEDGQDTDTILRRVKRTAAFSGSLRTNLVSMLDGIGIPEALGLGSSAELFTVQSESLKHATSAVRYPVFKAGKNYTGSSPTIPDSALLAPYLDVLADEADQVAQAIIVPLGKAVETALRWLIDAGRVDEARCLFGFPHPSGADAHRISQYETNRDRLSEQVAGWFTEFVPLPTADPSRCAVCGSLHEDPAFASSYVTMVCGECEARAVNSWGNRPVHGPADLVEEDDTLVIRDWGDHGDNPVFIDGHKRWRRYKFGGFVTMRDLWDSPDISSFYDKVLQARDS